MAPVAVEVIPNTLTLALLQDEHYDACTISTATPTSTSKSFKPTNWDAIPIKANLSLLEKEDRHHQGDKEKQPLADIEEVVVADSSVLQPGRKTTSISPPLVAAPYPVSHQELLACVTRGDLKALSALIPQRPYHRVNEVRLAEGGWTLILEAVLREHDQVLAFLLNRGFDPNLSDDVGHTPLWWASSHGWCEGVNLLISGGANPNLASNTGSTPLLIAANDGHTDVSKCQSGCMCSSNWWMSFLLIPPSTFWSTTIQVLMKAFCLIPSFSYSFPFVSNVSGGGCPTSTPRHQYQPPECLRLLCNTVGNEVPP